MSKRILLPLLAVLLILPLMGQAQTVTSDHGNLVLRTSEGKEVQLTHTGRDSEPSVSPDGRWIVFVRTYPERPGWAGAGTELWIVHPNGSGEHRIVKDGKAAGPNEYLGALKLPHFLSDSRRVAFHSAWAAVHGSVHVVDIKSGSVRFVTAGNSVDVVPAGKYKDYLIVMLHKYFLVGGTYDWYWLMTIDGKEVAPIGGSKESLSMFYEMYVESEK